jgi:hypothetical protein
MVSMCVELYKQLAHTRYARNEQVIFRPKYLAGAKDKRKPIRNTATEHGAERIRHTEGQPGFRRKKTASQRAANLLFSLTFLVGARGFEPPTT